MASFSRPFKHKFVCISYLQYTETTYTSEELPFVTAITGCALEVTQVSYYYSTGSQYERSLQVRSKNEL